MLQIHREIETLQMGIGQLFDMAKIQTKLAFEAIEKFDQSAAEELLLNEKQINLLEKMILGQAERILALFSPVARDLRLIIVATRITADLEHICDNAKGIINYLLELETNIPKSWIEDFNILSGIIMVEKMFKKANLALTEYDPDLIESLWKIEIELNDFNLNANDQLIEKLSTNNSPADIRLGITLLTIVRKTERIGDYLFSIANDLAYLHTGNQKQK